MNVEEAVGVLAMAQGTFSEVHAKDERTVHLKYTGTDPEEEGRVAQALIVYGNWIAEQFGTTLSIANLETDAVHVKQTPGAQE